ncbi:hypothetical protein B0F90DRAFT_555758 [Multifurca ochricompacta]|uniref:Uncharacterized protein n=1 Tax=Multifurca ochricompacta TaxID=376703 RepID=A0AAD4MC30_9AGAM|nr:hypothetical protein B0F90DRAFT_555758 [Multifurca ochricompacta]
MPESSPPVSGRAIYDTSISGAQDHSYITRLRSDAPPYHSLPQSLVEFRVQEGREYRKARLRALWMQLLAALDSGDADSELELESYPVGGVTLTPESAREMRKMYNRELIGCCNSSGHIGWKEFKKYAEDKEAGKSFLFRI